MNRLQEVEAAFRRFLSPRESLGIPSSIKQIRELKISPEDLTVGFKSVLIRGPVVELGDLEPLGPFFSVDIETNRDVKGQLQFTTESYGPVYGGIDDLSFTIGLSENNTTLVVENGFFGEHFASIFWGNICQSGLLAGNISVSPDGEYALVTNHSSFSPRGTLFERTHSSVTPEITFHYRLIRRRDFGILELGGALLADNPFHVVLSKRLGSDVVDKILKREIRSQSVPAEMVREGIKLEPGSSFSRFLYESRGKTEGGNFTLTHFVPPERTEGARDLWEVLREVDGEFTQDYTHTFPSVEFSRFFE